MLRETGFVKLTENYLKCHIVSHSSVSGSRYKVSIQRIEQCLYLDVSWWSNYFCRSKKCCFIFNFKIEDAQFVNLRVTELTLL